MSIPLSKIYSQARTARRVLVVDLGFLGDTVHLVPALWDLKRACPEAELHVLTSTLGVETLRLAPCVHRAWGIDMYPETRSLLQQWRVLRGVRQARFDLALNFSGADRSLFLTGFSGARLKVAHESARKQFWRRWLIAHWVPQQDPLLPVYEQRRQVLRAAGFPLAAPAWDLQVPAEALARAATLRPEGAVHFSINASHPLKEWPLGHWIDLARLLLSSDPRLRIVATASRSPHERDRLRAFVSGAADERVLAIPPGLSIAELAGVLKGCRLHVGADSGVLHLAVALGVPTVSLFRQYQDVSAWLPTGPAHQVVSIPCECVNQRDGPCHPFGPAQCLERIAPAQVAAMVHACSNQCYNPQR